MIDGWGARARIYGFFRVAAGALRLHADVLAQSRARVCLRRADGVGIRARCHGRVHLQNAGTVRIGDDLEVGGPLASVHVATGRGGILGIGDAAVIGQGTAISARSLVSIGDRVRIGDDCVISDAELPLPLALLPERGPRGIMIGDDAWIGARVKIMPGVRIGARAIIAAGSVVAHDIEDDALAAGSPATVLRVARGGDDVAPAGDGRRVASRARDGRRVQTDATVLVGR